MEYIFYNGIILTMDGTEEPQAVLVKDSYIACIGTVRECRKMASVKVETIDLDGNVLLPGFIDTHTHFFEYAKTFVAVDLSPAESVDDFRRILVQYRANMPSGINWVGGSGWNKNIYPDLTGFNKHLLDEIFPDIPVSLESKDFHSKICNSLALERAGITRETPDPAGGRIGRFPDGEPDGFTYEKAWELIDRVVPPYPENIAKEAVKKAQEECYRYGLTAIHSMENADKFELYRKMIEEKDLKLRVCWHFPSNLLDEMIRNDVTSYSGGELLKTGGMKIFMDGSLGSQSAWMYEPYDGTTLTGMPLLSESELYNLVKRAAEHGISSTIHGIGDRCNHVILSVIERVNKELGSRLPHRIEHLQCIREEDYQLINENNVYCAVQPVHIKADVQNIKKYWSHVEKNVYPLKSLLETGVTLGFGSDAPVETINPFEGVYAALERKYRNDPDEEGWQTEQCLGVMEAIRGYTIEAAKGSKSEELRGSITEGKLADLIVIEELPGVATNGKDYASWLVAETKLTMINGEIVRNLLDVDED
jgi:predicted amidohydrolase YtcJ